MRASLLFPGVLLLYLVLGSGYAVETPPWQAPDEPAHYNYIKHLAETRTLPVLQPGDYDQAYLSRLTSEKFPPSLSIDSLRYESHQPPLYYTLAVPVYLLVRVQPVPVQVTVLREFSLVVGILLLLVVRQVTRELFPDEPALAIAAPALIATLPQQLAVAASINNDILAEVVISALLLVQIRFIRSRGAVADPVRSAIVFGFLLGLALLTKTTIYVALALLPAAAWLAHSALGIARRFSETVLLTLLSYSVAFAVSGWWFARNIRLYGLADPLGQARHDQIVLGQPTANLLEPAVLADFFATTFRSFWVQLGWMAVPAEGSTYGVLALLSLAALLGLIAFLREPRTPTLTSALWLLFLAFLFALGALVGYNFRFFQAQGRYLFPAILSLALFFIIGLHHFFARRFRLWLLGLTFLGLLSLNLLSLTSLLPLLR